MGDFDSRFGLRISLDFRGFLLGLDFGGDGWVNFFARELIFGDHLSTTVVGFWDNIFVSKAEINRAISSSLFCVIIFASVSTVEIIVSFEPLNEF